MENERDSLIREARRLERSYRWREAAETYRRAASSRILRSSGGASRRADLAGLAEGTVLRRRRHGVVQAECTYVSPTEIRYAGASYPTLTAAAVACARDLGLRGTRGINGWWFWGVERQESAA